MPLPQAERRRLETALDADLSAVRVHAGADATSAADALDARAFAVGTDIHFGAGQYAPDTRDGRHLLAHEIAHTVQQQRGAAPSTLPVTQAGEPHETAADRFADAFVAGMGHTARVAPNSAPAAIARAPKGAKSEPLPEPATAIRKGASLGGGKISFYPRSVGSSRLGTVQPGAPDAFEHLDVIVNQGTTITLLATLLLPLWNDAGPAQPDPKLGEGDVPPLPLSVDMLARGLLAHNQQLLPVPTMQNWKPGLRLPLPVMIDASGNAVVNPHLIAILAGGFAPEWTPLLTQAVGAAATVDPAEVKTQVAAFLTGTTNATGRGAGLATRALTNARAEQPFVREALNQISGGGGAAEVALWFMDTVGAKVSVLSSQAEGVAILDAIRAILAAAPPDQLAAHPDLASKAATLLETGRGVEVTLALGDWPNSLPHANRGSDKALQIKKKPDSSELVVPSVATGKPSEAQQRIAAQIKSARDQLPDADPKLVDRGWGKDSKAGQYYGGAGNRDKPTRFDGSPTMTAILEEIGGEGGWSAVNTYDDAIVTLGRGFTRPILAQMMQKLFAADPAIANQLLGLGVTWSGTQALVVDTSSGLVEEGDNALQILHANPKIINLFVTLAESGEHRQKVVDAQFDTINQIVGNVPPSIASWDKATIQLAAHLIWFRTGKNWPAYEGTGGNVAAILRVAAPLIGKQDPSVGNAWLLDAKQTGILRSFAKGRAAAGMGAPGALPADVTTKSYEGHVFFEGSGGHYHIAP